MPPIEGTSEGAAPAAESAPVTFESVAQSVVDAHENPPAADGDTGDTPPVAAPGAEGTPEGEAPAGEEGAEGEGAEDSNEILDALADIDRETLSDENKALYDDLLARGKSMQADYTRKTQRVAEQAKSVEQQIQEGIQQALANLPQYQQQGVDNLGDAEGPDLEQIVWQGLGEPLSIEQVMESSNPQDLANFITAQARLQVAEAMQGVIMPRIDSFAQFAETQAEAQAGEYLDAFVAANPDAEPWLGEAIGLVEAGVEPDLESAASTLRWKYNGQQTIAQAVELGVQAGAARKAEVDNNRQRFSVPSSSTKPPEADTIRKGMSFDEVAAQVAKDFGG